MFNGTLFAHVKMRKVIERHERRRYEGDERRKDTSHSRAFGEKHSSQRLTSIPLGQILEHLAASNTLGEGREGEREEDPVKARGCPRAYNLPTD